jgi:hypothetical protein
VVDATAQTEVSGLETFNTGSGVEVGQVTVTTKKVVARRAILLVEDAQLIAVGGPRITGRSISDVAVT